MRAAAVQLNSSTDRQRNLAHAEELVRAAQADGAELVVLPEHYDLRGSDELYLDRSEPLDGTALRWASELARALAIDLIAGSIAERRSGRMKPSNSSVHIGPDGVRKAVYRKIHLFDVSVGGVDYRESDSCEPGDGVVLSETAGGTPIGLSVCYDLRFPELYRAQAIEGALVLAVPSNFTRLTGEAHWEVLLRARAIENQAFVIAAAQSGAFAQGEAYGNSMIVDPWGEVLARAGESGECFIAAELDLARQAETRSLLPSLAGRVPDAYGSPLAVGTSG